MGLERNHAGHAFYDLSRRVVEVLGDAEGQQGPRLEAGTRIFLILCDVVLTKYEAPSNHLGC